MKVGVISGNKIPDFISDYDEVTIDTDYGSIQTKICSLDNHTVFFISRHGIKADLPPHKVMYHANIQALAASHVNYIIGIGTVGSLQKQILPGEFVIPHDFIDMTKNRRNTFFDTARIHVDFTQPFCQNIRKALIHQSKKICESDVHNKGIYLVTEGPRLETVAEINMFQKFADIVGMTLSPEAVLARERGICYASLCIVCNMAAGMQKMLSAEEIVEVYKEKESTLSTIIKNTIIALENIDGCNCSAVLDKASL